MQVSFLSCARRGSVFPVVCRRSNWNAPSLGCNRQPTLMLVEKATSCTPCSLAQRRSGSRGNNCQTSQGRSWRGTFPVQLSNWNNGSKKGCSIALLELAGSPSRIPSGTQSQLMASDEAATC